MVSNCRQSIGGQLLPQPDVLQTTQACEKKKRGNYLFPGTDICISHSFDNINITIIIIDK